MKSAFTIVSLLSLGMLAVPGINHNAVVDASVLSSAWEDSFGANCKSATLQTCGALHKFVYYISVFYTGTVCSKVTADCNCTPLGGTVQLDATDLALRLTYAG
ncbi:hypothetical protein F5H01DRAFT_348629 [Linnemannia elongata]|nr:hypothetical protein F5H01DRAFT_348629 [Linnemannia elongata]